MLWLSAGFCPAPSFKLFCSEQSKSSASTRGGIQPTVRFTSLNLPALLGLVLSSAGWFGDPKFLSLQSCVLAIICFLAVTLFLGLLLRFVSKTGKFHKERSCLLLWLPSVLRIPTPLKFSDSVEVLRGLRIQSYSWI